MYTIISVSIEDKTKTRDQENEVLVWQCHGLKMYISYLLSGYYKGSDVRAWSQFAQPMNNMYVWAWCIDKHNRVWHACIQVPINTYHCTYVWSDVQDFPDVSNLLGIRKEKKSFGTLPLISVLFFLSFSSRWETAVTYYCGVLVIMFMRVRLWVFLYFLFLLLNAHCSPSRFGRK